MIVVSFQLKGQVYTVTAPNATANTMVKYRQRHGYLSVDERMGFEIQAGYIYVTSPSPPPPLPCTSALLNLSVSCRINNCQNCF